MGPFDISPEDVQTLDDNQLRRILGSLLEAEAHQHSIPLSAIGIGGHQNALDGGVDARVQWDEQPPPTPWLPRNCTVFQSKAEDMGSARVSSEMAPGGQVRPLFQELAGNLGSYIIFSTVNCSDQMYRDRVQAMQTAIAGVPGGEGIHLEFYDASRIARWVNSFQGVASELREMIERPLSGWHPYENWSAPQLSAEDEYIVDENPKVTLDYQDGILLVTDAIDQIRTLLHEKSNAVRLVGLSGVGKTRFGQVLFDPRVGAHPLNKGCAVYGDLSESPATPPSQVAEQLSYSQRESVLIVDNCPENTHRALANIVCRDGSRVSLLTIDFDIGKDKPENTRVFELHENAAGLIETLLARRVPGLSPLDRPRVVDFAGGNARVALAIARNSEPGEALADLSDRQLLSRLFLDERRRLDEEMLRIAEVASLVYAFHVEREENQMPEHPVLAELAEVTELTMYRCIAQFCEDLGIAQKRGKQRAILPRALAVKLAIQCLDRLPPEQVLNHFYPPEIKRLFTSFCRRLGDLHKSENACQIVRGLIEVGGNFFDLPSLSPEDQAIFASLAPVLQQESLAALEQAATGPHSGEFLSTANPSRHLFITLLRNLAYEEALFERAAQVLLYFLKQEGEDSGNEYEEHREFLEMFWIVLSHTQAPPGLRFGFLDRVLANGEPVEKVLAVRALGYALETNHFASSFDNSFGSRPRGNEWTPENVLEQKSWFREVFTRLVTLACQDSELADPAKKEIEHSVRDLIDVLPSETISSGLRAIQERGFWVEGWKALCTAIHFDSEGWPEEIQQEMVPLEASLRPVSVEDRFCAYVISEPWGLYSVEDDGHEDDDERLIVSLAKKVGRDVAQDLQQFPELARRAMACDGQNASRHFGAGLAERVQSPQVAWDGMLANSP